MIRLESVKKTFSSAKQEVHALRKVDLEINDGEIFGIIGKSGAGKSTLIRCINVLERPDSGKVIIDGQEISALVDRQLRAARKKIGMIFQHFNLLTSRTVRQNIAVPLELAGLPRKVINAEVRRLLELVDLLDKADSYPAQLSGGQKQRVGIARALANNPTILLCDEATSALDPQTTKSILALLKTINSKMSITIVLITHEMQVIKEICDRVAVIEDGIIVETGKVLDIFTKPKSRTAREFITSITAPILPEDIYTVFPLPIEKAENSIIVRVSFVGEAARQPIISTMIKKFNVDANILFGNLVNIQEIPLGGLIIELSGEKNDLYQALDYLTKLELEMEVIGYAPRNDAATA